MKLFIREHILLVVLQVVQMMTIASLLWLSNIHEWPIVIYSLLLCSVFLFCYLVYQYVSRRKYYNMLTKQLTTLDDSLQPLDERPISLALGRLLRNQYDLRSEERRVGKECRYRGWREHERIARERNGCRGGRGRRSSK